MGTRDPKEKNDSAFPEEGEAAESDVEIMEITGKQEHRAANDSEGLKGITCVVCMEKPERLAAVPCGHYYCGDCVYTSLSCHPGANKTRGRCSVCRESVRYDQVLFLEMKRGKPVPKK